MDSPLDITLGARVSAYLVNTEDFIKQRKRVNKRLLKLRHEINIITKDTKNYRDKEKTSKIDAEQYASDNRYGLVLLLTAERDLLYSLQIKSLMEISSEKTSSYRTLMVSRIKKAVSNSKKLLTLMKDEKDSLKVLEVYVYTALAQGMLSVNKRQWGKASNAFAIAKCALDLLASRSDESEDQEYAQSRRTIINETIDSVVNPSLGLAISRDDSIEDLGVDLNSAARKLAKSNTVAYLLPAVTIIESIDPKFVSDIGSSVSLARSVEWRNYEAKIYNDEVAFRIMNLNDTKTTNWQEYTDANQFDQLSAAWLKISDLHADDVEKFNDDEDLDKSQDMAVLLTYLNYHLLFTRLKRDLLLIGQLQTSKDLSSRKDIVRLYDAINDTIESLKDLPGVYNDSDLFESLENLSLYYNWRKYVTLSDLYTKNRKFPEALKINKYVEDQVEKANPEDFYKVKGFPYDITNIEEFFHFKEQVKSLVFHSHVSAQFLSEVTPAVPTYAIQNINNYIGPDLKLVNLDLETGIEPVLCKPVLFDMAFNYINYDFGSEPEAPGKKKGFFGFFK